MPAAQHRVLQHQGLHGTVQQTMMRWVAEAGEVARQQQLETDAFARLTLSAMVNASVVKPCWRWQLTSHALTNPDRNLCGDANHWQQRGVDGVRMMLVGAALPAIATGSNGDGETCCTMPILCQRVQDADASVRGMVDDGSDRNCGQ